jgi:ribosomal protein S18 acetylase RimI-like enzyme
LTVSARPEPSAHHWRIRLEVDEPGSRVAAAVDGGGTIIGLATGGATRDDDALTPWELYSIHVTAAQQGRGVADDLIRAVAGSGDGDAAVWVLAQNTRAQRFYRRHGFRVEGASAVDEFTGARQIRMVRVSGLLQAGAEKSAIG